MGRNNTVTNSDELDLDVQAALNLAPHGHRILDHRGHPNRNPERNLFYLSTEQPPDTNPRRCPGALLLALLRSGSASLFAVNSGRVVSDALAATD